jgi:hypothetical protein
MRVSDGKTIRVTAPAGGVVVHGFYRASKFHGFAQTSQAAGQEVDLEIDPRAVHRFAVPGGLTANKGDILYIPAAGTGIANLTATATGNFPAIMVTSTKDGNNIIEGFALNGQVVAA